MFKKQHRVPGLVISTIEVKESHKPYETAVSHSRYSNGAWIVVETYSSLADAVDGHQRWISKMEGRLPNQLIDKSQAYVALTNDSVNPGWRIHKKVSHELLYNSLL